MLYLYFHFTTNNKKGDHNTLQSIMKHDTTSSKRLDAIVARRFPGFTYESKLSKYHFKTITIINYPRPSRTTAIYVATMTFFEINTCLLNRPLKWFKDIKTFTQLHNYSSSIIDIHTVHGQNPAPVHRYNRFITTFCWVSYIHGAAIS